MSVYLSVRPYERKDLRDGKLRKTITLTIIKLATCAWARTILVWIWMHRENSIKIG